MPIGDVSSSLTRGFFSRTYQIHNMKMLKKLNKVATKITDEIEEYSDIITLIGYFVVLSLVVLTMIAVVSTAFMK